MEGLGNAASLISPFLTPDHLMTASFVDSGFFIWKFHGSNNFLSGKDSWGPWLEKELSMICQCTNSPINPHPVLQKELTKDVGHLTYKSAHGKSISRAFRFTAQVLRLGIFLT